MLTCCHRDCLEHQLSKVQAEKEYCLSELQLLRDKFKHTKDRHRNKGSHYITHTMTIVSNPSLSTVKKLTNELSKLSIERDTFQQDLLEVQSSHTRTQSLLDRHSSSHPVSIPFDEHQKTLREFEMYI